MPELLAPAGDERALQAALQAGADAVYFGLSEGLNARARTANFALADLPALCDRIHRAGCKAYLTLNTLVFEEELPVVAAMVAAAARAGIDALIVQDPAVALLARSIAPTLHVHASTQMTVSSPEAAAFAQALGVVRVVVPRELSVAEIRQYAAGTPLELEVFAHGALCMAWSGQCLTSEAWGGRSANRGQCAQSCRMPYDLVVDGRVRDLGDVRYLLSPLDLAGLATVPELAEAGVRGLKIEGRQKGPEYVATAVAGYRQQLDRIGAGQPCASGEVAAALTRMALSYSRGFSPGFLRGSDHQHLVEGRFPKHRGVLLGTVAERSGQRARVVATVRTAQPDCAPQPVTPKPGLGVGFDGGHPERDEPGGPLFAVEPTADGWWLTLGRGVDLSAVRAGDKVWATADTRSDRETGRVRAGEVAAGRIAVAMTAHGDLGQPLRTTWTAIGPVGRSVCVAVHSDETLQAAEGAGLTEGVLRDKLGALGATPFHLSSVLFSGVPCRLPVSALKALRRRAVGELEARVLAVARHAVVLDPHRAVERLVQATVAAPAPDLAPELLPLVRTDAQLDAVVAAEMPEVILDWMDLVGLTRAVDKARAAGLRVCIATVRVQKPGEDGFDRRFARLRPDAVLVRHWGALVHFARLADADKPEIRGDFSLNVTNSVTANHLLGWGAQTLTAAHDLDERQLHHLLGHIPPRRMEVVVHQHIATFHTEHCVYAHTLSQGKDFRDCGRPCERHRLGLRDHLRQVHPVVVDVGCRNTVFNAQAQTAARLVPGLLAAGVRRFRAEFVHESADQVRRVLDAYRDLLAGRCDPATAVRRVGVHEQFGVTQGTFRVLGATP
ncbi:MAG: U32 family peptidase [Deltaproteobacteria bacterium]|nr:U32 family peptidase [Deltaproteobacteria bacterium]